jgi:hypothetical protein
MTPLSHLIIGPVKEHPLKSPVVISCQSPQVSPSSTDTQTNCLDFKIPSVTGSNKGRSGSLRSNHVANNNTRPGKTSTISAVLNEPGTPSITVLNDFPAGNQVIPPSVDLHILIVLETECFMGPF